MTKSIASPLIRLVALAATLAPAIAGAQIFSGVDALTGVVAPASAPNTTTARNNMLAALGATPFSLNTFEGLALGSTTNLGGGVTATYNGQFPGLGGIVNVNDSQLGFNTTAGGSQFLSQGPDGPTGSLTLTFSTAINFFGAYLSGVEGACGTTTAVWGVTSFVLPSSGGASCSGSGGLQWFGFVAPVSASFTSITFNQVRPGTRDIIGLDDMIYGARVSAIPEPGTYAMLGLGLVAVAVTARRRRRA